MNQTNGMSSDNGDNARARTKRDIVRQIADELGLTRKLTGQVVQRTFDAILDAIVMDERVEFRNFGVFIVKKRLARKARNPKTGEEIDVPAKYVVTFKAGKELEARVRELAVRDSLAEGDSDPSKPDS